MFHLLDEEVISLVVARLNRCLSNGVGHFRGLVRIEKHPNWINGVVFFDQAGDRILVEVSYNDDTFLFRPLDSDREIAVRVADLFGKPS